MKKSSFERRRLLAKIAKQVEETLKNTDLRLEYDYYKPIIAEILKSYHLSIEDLFNKKVIGYCSYYSNYLTTKDGRKYKRVKRYIILEGNIQMEIYNHVYVKYSSLTTTDTYGNALNTGLWKAFRKWSKNKCLRELFKDIN